ncbi:hypothetical protein Pmar_PMAR015904 [Perkinsus marinus ATCC 50983]|uniref:Uncharacterized protein n=1 Tax=Perkinsus marinus (strain ATCC 50983 / TXsc) TaxID=423536 RepID=C5LTI9_PERM5|nr:hypothetical protein Pmar_PMAR015904 [Perkinsus marinus ATCC 50983]EEQ99952.1 hypothetical protein Pmar_PMAR015904 [Perkinsus marinus ATCC 50983]|eukprot:XP_002767235.1 hypothetical protein Pmar_PMAR015904 [Perkinsus marinus ATCC 50983]
MCITVDELLNHKDRLLEDLKAECLEDIEGKLFTPGYDAEGKVDAKAACETAAAIGKEVKDDVISMCDFGPEGVSRIHPLEGLTPYEKGRLEEVKRKLKGDIQNVDKLILSVIVKTRTHVTTHKHILSIVDFAIFDRTT